MKRVFFVTEGVTDQIVLEGLVKAWLGEDFLANRIQPPTSEYARDAQGLLSQGWKGVHAWCSAANRALSASKAAVIASADILIVHMDSDVATEVDFPSGRFAGAFPPARAAVDHVRAELTAKLGVVDRKIVLCVPAQNIEAWIVAALFPDLAARNAPIECHANTASLLHQRPPYKLVRTKGGVLKKQTPAYESAMESIIEGWPRCSVGAPAVCEEAARFEVETRSSF